MEHIKKIRPIFNSRSIKYPIFWNIKQF